MEPVLTNEYLILVDRYLPNGSPDLSFAPNGRMTVDLGNGGTYGALAAMTVQPDGAPLLYTGAGDEYYHPTEAVVRLAAQGLSVHVVDAAAPVVSLSTPTSSDEESSFTADLSASDPDGDGIRELIVNWGDGSIQVVPGNTSSLSHVYPDGPATESIRLSAVDGDGSITQVTSTLTVNNVPPTLTVTGDPQVNEGSPYALQFTATDPGPDTISGWKIDWGDGVVKQYSGVSTVQHTYEQNGQYTILVSATDEDGTYSASPHSVLVKNVPPTIVSIGPRVAAADAVFHFTGTLQDVVPENFTGTIDWGDGTAPSPFNASADSPAASAKFDVDHTYTARGSYTITVTASDGDDPAIPQVTTVQVGDLVLSAYQDDHGGTISYFYEPARAGETAYLDLNRDGYLEDGEPAEVTDAFGDALFDQVAPGTYAARLVVPRHWHLTTPQQGYADVTPGTVSSTAQFGLTQTATITGSIFNDANGNGVRDAGEGPALLPVLARPTDNPMISFGGNVDTTTGNYIISNVPPGQYIVSITSGSWVTTAPAGAQGYFVSLTGDQSTVAGLNFGEMNVYGAGVAGSAFSDLNGNGLRDSGEPARPGVTVYIDANNNDQLDPNELWKVTNSQGNWSMNRIAGGTYRIRQLLPPGTPEDAPGVSQEVTLTLGQTVTTDIASVFDNTYYLSRFSDSSVRVFASSRAYGNAVMTYPVSDSSPLVINSGNGKDWIILDASHGNPMTLGGLQLNDSGGDDTLSILGGSSSDDVSIGSGTASLAGQNFTFTGFEHVTFDGQGGDDSVSVGNGDALVLARSQVLDSLTLADSALVTSVAGRDALQIRNLSFGTGALLDLLTGSMIIPAQGNSPPGGWNGTTYTGISGLIASGAIRSSAAQQRYTTLGIATGGELFGLNGPHTALWEGSVVYQNDALIKFTYAGDANLDGRINIDDYGRIDSNVGRSGSVYDWYDGDFNFDGKVNIDDYGLIDSVIGAQGPIFS